jgi:serine/threonine protein kinase
MSPQILNSKPYTMKNDVWAIGLMYYEMLCGKTPWNVKTMNDLATMPKTVPIQFPFNVHISKMSKSFILGCLAYEESERLSWD